MKKVSALDVSKYILHKKGQMTAMKLQKLLYYCQAWSLVWDEEAIFKERIEAWANGPVVRKIYNLHRGKFNVNYRMFSRGNIRNLYNDQKETIDAILKYYANKPSQWLSDLTHMEVPWKNARAGLLPSERGNKVIKLADMNEYYSSLLKD